MAKRVIVVRVPKGEAPCVFLRIKKPPTREEISALGKIKGVSYYGTDRGRYPIHIGLTNDAKWRELAPQAFLVLADALGITVDDMTLVNEWELTNDLSWIVDKAKKLR